MKVKIKNYYYNFPEIGTTGDLIGYNFIGTILLYVVKIENSNYVYFPEDLIYDSIED